MSRRLGGVLACNTLTASRVRRVLARAIGDAATNFSLGALSSHGGDFEYPPRLMWRP